MTIFLRWILKRWFCQSVVNAMLLAKPNPQNYYSVTVALFRPNLLIELKRFLFISFFSLFLSPFIAFLLFSFLFSLSFYFLVLFISFFLSFVLLPIPFLAMSEPKLALFCSLSLTKRRFCLPLLFSYFYVGAMSFLYAQRCSRRICVVLLIYNNVGCRKVCVDCCFLLLTCAKIEQIF